MINLRSFLAIGFAAVSAIPAARAGDACAVPASSVAHTVGPLSVRHYRPVFENCQNTAGQSRIAIRRMMIAKDEAVLVVDGTTLQSDVQKAACWRCLPTDETAQKDTRFIKALNAPHQSTNQILRNAGLTRSTGKGAFLSADLCPSYKPLDRSFLDHVSAMGQNVPVALAVSGAWIASHRDDFDWLRARKKSGALAITWVNHAFRHPFRRGVSDGENFLLTPGLNIQSEILDTERLLIAHGELPSVFFRFPGLVADKMVMQAVRDHHLIALGADAWLVLSPKPRDGSIILVHANGNEPAGLALFERLVAQGKMPQPLRSILDAP
ncbi:MAG: polysaccharide deacetylase family protein [Beijerinckiaceae bacterium]